MGSYVPEVVRPLRRVEYDKLIELGMFDDDERIELIRGFLVPMAPIGPPHSATIDRLNRILVLALHDRAVVRVQNPIAALEDSEPQPDFSVVPLGDYDTDHPENALLLIEVADSSLSFDRGVKLGIYAECGVPEYWVVNLRHRRIEVFTEPEGLTYARIEHYKHGETLSPTRFRDVVIRVDDVLK
jgi:Uma2 family endonuclease